MGIYERNEGMRDVSWVRYPSLWSSLECLYIVVLGNAIDQRMKASTDTGAMI